MTAELLADAQRRLQQAAHRMSADGQNVRYRRCTLIAEHDRCLDLFEAASAVEVRRVNDIAQVPFRWIGQAAETAVPGAGT